MRHYQPLWIKIKTTGTATVIADPRVFARISKAVRKEKYIDWAYKELLKRSCQHATLKQSIDRNRKTITFTLVKSIGIEEL